MGGVSSAVGYLHYSFYSLLLGPTGDTPGKFPQHRAVVAARTAFAVWLAGALVFARPGLEQLTWVGIIFTTLVAALQPMIIERDFGPSLAYIITFSVGGTFLLGIGTAIAALAWLVGGMHFRDWVLFAFIAITPFFVVWASNVAMISPPRRVFNFASDSVAWVVTLPLFAFIRKGDVTSLEPLGKFFVNYVAWFWCAAAIAFFATILPFGLGAMPGWRSVPSLLAATLQGLGSYASAIAVGRSKQENPQLMVDPRSLLRYKVIEASATLRQYMMRAMLERCGGFYGQTPKLMELIRVAEVCRLSLTLQHAADLKPRSNGPQEVFYGGSFQEEVQDLQRITATTLHGAASLAANVAGHSPPKAELSGFPLSGSPFVDEEGCRRLAAECSAAADRFVNHWVDMSQSGQWADMLRQKSSNGAKPSAEEIMAAYPLSDICGAEASVVGALSAAQAASRAASSAADYAEEMAAIDSKCCTGWFVPCCGGIGCVHWFSIHVAGPKMWIGAFLRSWRFGLRLSVTMAILAVILILVPFPESDPVRGMWAVISAGLLLTPVQGAGVLKAVRRVIAAIIGSIFAFLLVLMTQWDYMGIWVWLGVAAFIVKFFEYELQYAGLAAFFTMSTVIGKALEYPHDIRRTLEDGFWRVAEILISVVVVGIVGTFIAPSRAMPKVRSSEMDALSCSAATCAAVSKGLALAIPGKSSGAPTKESVLSGQNLLMAGVPPSPKDDEGRGVDGNEADPDDEDEEPAPTLDELRTSAWGLFQQFFFGGDGRPGIGDTLVDAKWESYLGTASGYELLCGIFWVPTITCFFCLDSALARGRDCLHAVVDISSLTRSTMVLVSLLQSGFDGGGSVLLSDPRVEEALGPSGRGFAEAVKAAVGNVAPLLTGQGIEQNGVTRKLFHDLTDAEDFGFHDDLPAREKAVAAARVRLDEADRRFQLLMTAAHAGRSKVSGALMTPGQVTTTGGSTHRIAAALFLLQESLTRLRDIIDILAGEEATAAVNNTYAHIPSGSRSA